MLKGDRTEWAIEKAVELGVGEIVLYESDRGVTRLKEGRITSKLERFERIAEAAAKQSSRRSLAPISMHQSLRAALLNQRHGIFGDLGPTARPLRALNPLPRTWPEGGFTQEELSSLHAAQFTPISLGPLVLRAETAAITLLASMNALWGVPKS
jgi:16S rRNA (uracil1498-N3)-methyltransferase